MKMITLLFGMACLALASCSSPEGKKTGEDSLATADTSVSPSTKDTSSALCFLLTEGQTGQDTTSVELVIKGDSVTGVMNWMPYEKDARKGKLKGVKAGDEIKATWSFMQEGMTDTIGLQFKMIGDKLTQKPLKFNERTGRQQTDANADYRIIYQSHNKVYK